MNGFDDDWLDDLDEFARDCDDSKGVVTDQDREMKAGLLELLSEPKVIEMEIVLKPGEKQCAACQKVFKPKHPATRFCSNTGPGNCKDLFHNSQPHRIERTRQWMPTEEDE